MAGPTALAVISQITDAALTIQALTPFYLEFIKTGKEPTPDEVKQALSDMDAPLEAFDAEIKRQGG